jgi:hypothetical protein
MNTQTTMLEQMAYGLATAQIVSCEKFDGSKFDQYQFLTENASDDEKLEDWIVAPAFANLEWPDVVENIDCEAQAILSAMKESLEFAKQGLVLATNGPLRNVFSGLDMQRMVDVGAKAQIQ